MGKGIVTIPARHIEFGRRKRLEFVAGLVASTVAAFAFGRLAAIIAVGSSVAMAAPVMLKSASVSIVSLVLGIGLSAAA